MIYGPFSVYDDMNFYITPEHFLVEANGENEILVIDRISCGVKVQHKTNQLQNKMPNRRVCGILGTITLLGGQYLIVATHRLYVGIIYGAIIWRLAGYDIIPYIPSLTHLTLEQKQQNETYLKMIRKTLDTQYFFFSYVHDMTHTLQRIQRMPPDFQRSSLFERSDARFVWNAHLLRNFDCPDMSRFQLPIILGFVSINQVQVGGQTFFWSIISRRSIKRAGTRLFRRGIDENGDVANFVETEQIVECGGQRLSFVQTRGSMPFFWRQLPNLKCNPPSELVYGKDHLAAFGQHFDEQMRLYGSQVLVNLVDQKGAEGRLETMYRTLVLQFNNPYIRYEAFDFHAECKKMCWDRLNILLDRLQMELEEMNIFHIRNDGKLLSTQSGVFRMNCADCLDRTNVVQSMLAKRSLNIMLERLGILTSGEKVERSAPKFEMIYKNVWADNADLISLQYSGTGALNTDFTRTGKRTKAGLLQDGINSLTRYYLNNFADGLRQDGIDLFLGNYTVQKDEGKMLPSPLIIKKGWRYKTFPSVLVFGIAMFFVSTIFPTKFKTENMLFLLFWGAMIFASSSGLGFCFNPESIVENLVKGVQELTEFVPLENIDLIGYSLWDF